MQNQYALIKKQALFFSKKNLYETHITLAHTKKLRTQ